MRIELILVAGFLESGKTKLINSLKVKLHEDDYPVVISCEGGFTRLDGDFKDIVYIDQISEISTTFFEDLIKRYPNRKFVMEYNGTWPLSYLYSISLPRNMIIQKTIYTLNYTTHEQYLLNMPTLLLEQINYSDALILTGIDDISNFKGRARRLVNDLKPGIMIYSQDEYKFSNNFKIRKSSINWKMILLLLLIIILWIWKRIF